MKETKLKVDSIEINGETYFKEVQTNSLPYVIVRTYSAGVFTGFLKSRDGKEGVMKDARRLWYWSGAASLSQLAMEGVKNPNECKFPCTVDEVILTEIVEIITCTKEAKKSIDSVKIWSA